MQDNIVSELTLEYLMNKEQYAKYIGKNAEKTKGANKKDKKFYRKRIVDLTKQLLNNEPSEEILQDIIKSFDSYAKICVDYFKMVDRRDILQEEHENFNSEKNEDDVKNEKDEKDENVYNTNIQQESDKLFMRTFHIKEPNSLEKIVKRKITKISEKPPFVPIQKEINLKDPVLKNKGIRKKNNINNKYEETS